MRRIRYQEIADELRTRYGDAAVGSMLPSESEMSAEFGASRVTIRRALELVRDDGLIAARQGFGWYVAGEPVRQSLETLGTIEAHIEGVGKLAERKIEEFEIETAPGRVRAILGVEQVLRVKRVNLADGEPFAVVTVWCPADLGGALSRADVTVEGIYETGFVEHAYIEPEAGFARMVGDRIEVHACTQAPVMDLESLPLILGIDRARIRIVPTAVGGGFGSKLDISVQPYLALAAMVTGRPVRLTYSRTESMQSTTKRHPALMKARLGATKDGRLQGFEFTGECH